MATMGISTNTRLLGLAIIKQGCLVDYSIHLNKSSWSPSKANMIVTSLEPCVRQYCIKRVALSIPYAHHQTEAFKHLVLCIQKYFETKEIFFTTKTSEALHTLYPPGKKKTKKAFMEAVTHMYPQLSFCLQKELRNKNKYYVKLFEAVAMASLMDK